jgi:dTMP kinase
MFVTFEGGEGSGKTSIITEVKDYFESIDKKVIVTREPGGTGIANQIRAILLDSKNSNLCNLAELLLYQSARSQLLNEVIRPNLKAGNVVLCDRFIDSTIAYQGYARGWDLDIIYYLQNLVCGNTIPDITILLDVEPKIGIKRSFLRLEEVQKVQNIDEKRFEKEALTFHEKVRTGYLEISRKNPDRFLCVDTTNLTQKQVSETVIATLKNNPKKELRYG